MNFSLAELILLKKSVKHRIIMCDNLIKAAGPQKRPTMKLEEHRQALWQVYHRIEEEENKEGSREKD